jgi:hypothetical protein
MAEKRLQRRLAAVLAADVVGYSREKSALACRKSIGAKGIGIVGF